MKVTHDIDQPPLPPSVRRARDAGIARAEAAEDAWWRSIADRAVLHLCVQGHDFSSNDLRALDLPEPRNARAWAARMLVAAKKGLVEAVGAVRSDKPSSHGAWVTVWRPTDKARQIELAKSAHGEAA